LTEEKKIKDGVGFSRKDFEESNFIYQMSLKGGHPS
jgi:hypothetical protein